mmetsp:Transcript_8844/g.9787  ORF Transcript_8844/g.9787 Transcript_8844/m.9787 type:complete len:179 (-) Transcript_8844:226-762(-)
MPFKDVENEPLVNNPYSNNNGEPDYYRPLSKSEKIGNAIYRVAVLGASLYYLHTIEFYKDVLRSPKIGHEWFKVGLAASTAILLIKFYVEIFEGKMNKKAVNYTNFRQSTHCILFLVILASLSFHIALWEQFGGLQTIFIMCILVGYGVLVQVSMLIPIYVQNVGGFVLLTLFIQQYV